MIVLDTCVIIDLLSGKGRSEEIRNIIQTQSVAVSAISINELLVNAHQSKKRIISEFLQSVHILPFDQDTAFMSVEFEDELTLKGTKIGKLDLFIAATCRFHNLPLLTSDHDFERLSSLEIILV